MEELIEIFKEEAEEMLNSWKSDSLTLEKGLNEEALDSLIRTAHTLKGSAEVVGLEELGKFAHVVEDFIKEYKERNLADEKALVEILFASYAVMSSWLNKDSCDDGQVEDVLSKVAALLGHLDGLSRRECP